MSLKLKAIALGLLATTAIGMVGVMNASAKAGGHFMVEKAHSHIRSFEEGNHKWHFVNHGIAGETSCTLTLTTTATALTLESLSLTATYHHCTTTGSETSVPTDVNGCTYTFTVAQGTTDLTEQTVHNVCPAGQAIKMTHPNCTLTIHPQTANSGVTYTHKTDPLSQKNEITLDVEVQHTVTRHGLCQFVAPTTGVGTTKASLTLKAFDTEGFQIHLTAT